MTAPPIPDKIRSNILNLAVDTHRYEAGLEKDILDMLDELGQTLIKDLAGSGLDTPRTDWQRSRLQALLEEATTHIDEAYGTIGQAQASEAKDLVRITADGTVKAINDALDAKILLTPRFTGSMLKALASDTLIQGAPSAEWWSRQADDLQQAFSDQMRQGMLRGENLTQLRDRIMGHNIPGVDSVGKIDLRKVPFLDRGPIHTARRNAQALVRTSVLTVNNAASQAVYEANSDIVDGLEWCSALDARVCLSCGALDGESWNFGEPHPTPPLHWGCRCVCLPKLKSWEQLAREAHGNSTLAKELDKMPSGNRASMDGPVSADLKYEDWFAQQSEERQREILGPGKFKLWQDGKIGWSDMIGQNGNALTITELKALHS